MRAAKQSAPTEAKPKHEDGEKGKRRRRGPEDPRLTAAKRRAFATVRARLGSRMLRECMKPYDRERAEIDTYYAWAREFYKQAVKDELAPIIAVMHAEREARRLAAELKEIIEDNERRRALGFAPPAPMEAPRADEPPGPFSPHED